jgi:hypothetical protein
MSETPETSASAQASQTSAQQGNAGGNASTTGVKQDTAQQSSGPQSGAQQAKQGNGNGGNSAGSKARQAENAAEEEVREEAGQSTIAEIQRDAARLLAADIARVQAREAALVSGFDHHQDALEEAEANYDEVRAGTDNEAIAYAYTALLNPRGMGSQSRQVDTSGTAGFTMSGAIVHAADVFGHPVQRAVAQMAKQSEADPLTVVGAVPHSDLVNPESVERRNPTQRTRDDNGNRHEK